MITEIFKNSISHRNLYYERAISTKVSFPLSPSMRNGDSPVSDAGGGFHRQDRKGAAASVWNLEFVFLTFKGNY